MVINMMELYKKIRELDNKGVHILGTIIDGSHIGEKALWSDMNLVYSSGSNTSWPSEDIIKLVYPSCKIVEVNGYKIFQDYCSSCHGTDWKGKDQLAPSLVGSPIVQGDVITTTKILLHGLTGPVDGKTYNGPMAPVAQYNNVEISDILSYIRAELNNSGTVWRGVVGNVREAYKDRDIYWTIKELEKNPGLPSTSNR